LDDQGIMNLPGCGRKKLWSSLKKSCTHLDRS